MERLSRCLVVFAIWLIVVSGLALGMPSAVHAQDFVIETVRENVYLPWSLNFAPDGRLFFTSRDTGEIHALDVRTGQLTTFTPRLPIRGGGEGGLLGMELDPDFARNGVLYVCYSTTIATPFSTYLPVISAHGLIAADYPRAAAAEIGVNRLSRLVLSGTQLREEQVLLTMPYALRHNGCRIVVSPDEHGYLFVSMGDAIVPERAQDVNSLSGKILRINRDGSIPADNPFPGSPVWTLGHRNPQGLAFQPGTRWLWSTEHGPDTRDELNIIKKGKNYGWPVCLGEQATCSVANYEPAVKEFYSDRTIAISDLVFYTGDAFPAWWGDIFFVTLRTGRLYRLRVSGEEVVQEEILINGTYGRLRDVTVGPDGFIYFSTDAREQATILRVRPKS
ncbi:MAG: PQQ-dependent sugar dehydrogenase [Anaerolineae bacterium]|nr:PQQ-dependent sugar dehydrogenase [Anaerolineae bacterium]MDW8069896.1 PQQ-dependent sugar dehydrogenase [Anaerolineae bacterium]